MGVSIPMPRPVPAQRPIIPPQPNIKLDSDGFIGYHEVLCLALNRARVRKTKDFAESDKLRDELKSLGAECHDKDQTFDWRGRTGSYNIDRDLDPQDIQYVALEREEVRKSGD